MEMEKFYLCVLFKNLSKKIVVSNDLFDNLNDRKKVDRHKIYKISQHGGETEVYILNSFGKYGVIRLD